MSSQLDVMYRMCKHEEMKAFADLIQDIPLSLADRFTLCQAPVNTSKPDVAAAVHAVRHSAHTHVPSHTLLSS